MNNSRLPNVLIVISINMVILNRDTVFILSFAKETQNSAIETDIRVANRQTCFVDVIIFYEGPRTKSE